MTKTEQNMLHSVEEIKERLEHIEVKMRSLFEVRPEYLKKLRRIEKEGYGETFTSIKELRRKIENK